MAKSLIKTLEDGEKPTADQLARHYGVKPEIVKVLLDIKRPGSTEWLIIDMIAPYYKQAQEEEACLKAQSDGGAYSEKVFFSPEYQVYRLLTKVEKDNPQIVNLVNTTGLLNQASKRFREKHKK